MPVIFIIHSDDDEIAARRLAPSLRDIGYEPTTDWTPPPDIVLILLTPNAPTSDRIQQDYHRVEEYPVLVLLLEDCEIPAAISSYPIIDFRQSFNSGLQAKLLEKR